MSIQDEQIKIRRARQGDEPAVAQVHIQSWQEAYKSLIPQDYLDNLTSELKERTEMWERITKNPQRWAWVAEGSNGIEKGKGVGFSLLSAGFNKMKSLGYKKAYCWALENNPTINFYERTGAKFSNQIKQDEIGDQKFNELAYEWNSLNIGDYNWLPLSVNEVKNTFKDFNMPWWIAGGLAIDLFLDKQTRKHDDIDILIQRKDQAEIQKLLIGWDLWAADPPGTLRPWAKGDFLGIGLQDIWCRKTPKHPWQIQIMLFDVENDEWVFKRDESIRRRLSSITVHSKDGMQLLAPEIQLLYKSKSLRAKDLQDFEIAIQSMSIDQKSWLKKTLQQVYKENHLWIEKL